MSAVSLVEPRPTRKTAGLPAGPRMPVPVQTAIWARNATWMLDQCGRRFGDTFTVEIAYEGVWVFLTRPDDVKRVFTGDPDRPSRRRGERRPLSGSRQELSAPARP